MLGFRPVGNLGFQSLHACFFLTPSLLLFLTKALLLLPLLLSPLFFLLPKSLALLFLLFTYHGVNTFLLERFRRSEGTDDEGVEGLLHAPVVAVLPAAAKA